MFEFKCENVIGACDDGSKRTRPLHKIDMIAVHRIGESVGNNAVEICRQFHRGQPLASYTGGENPYTFIIDKDGIVFQCLPIDEVSAHARKWNRRAIGIACIGDFRKVKPTIGQQTSLLELCTGLCGSFLLDPSRQLRGHTELPGASIAGKECPGKLLAIQEIRHEVRSVLTGTWHRGLATSGVEWDAD